MNELTTLIWSNKFDRDALALAVRGASATQARADRLPRIAGGSTSRLSCTAFHIQPLLAMVSFAIGSIRLGALSLRPDTLTSFGRLLGEENHPVLLWQAEALQRQLPRLNRMATLGKLTSHETRRTKSKFRGNLGLIEAA